MERAAPIIDKINELKTELRKNGLWKKEDPDWVNEYDKRSIITHEDFSEWLQFVYLPNLLPSDDATNFRAEKRLIVPQAVKFFGEDVKKGKLLHLLIELDALT